MQSVALWSGFGTNNLAAYDGTSDAGSGETQCLLDDIIIARAEKDEHFKILEEILARLNGRNMHDY